MATPETHKASTDGIQLIDDEEIVLENRHPSWTEWAGAVLLGVIILLGGLATADINGIIAGILFGGGLLAYVYFARRNSRYIVTTERVKKKVGLLRTKTGEARHEDIRSIGTESGFIEGLIGKGSVLIDSASAAGTLRIEGVDDYQGLANSIRRQGKEASG